MHHAVILIRAEKFQEVEALVREEKVVVENLSRYGVIEHLSEGPNLSREVAMRIHQKYQPPQNK